MNYRLNCQLAGWGSVQNPLDSEEHIPVEDGQVVVDERAVADALAAEYKQLVPAGDFDAQGDAEPEVEPESESHESDEQPTCVGNDGECSRSVDEEGMRCWQHEDQADQEGEE